MNILLSEVYSIETKLSKEEFINKLSRVTTGSESSFVNSHNNPEMHFSGDVYDDWFFIKPVPYSYSVYTRRFGLPDIIGRVKSGKETTTITGVIEMPSEVMVPFLLIYSLSIIFSFLLAEIELAFLISFTALIGYFMLFGYVSYQVKSTLEIFKQFESAEK